jgi:hypothetical protein
MGRTGDGRVLRGDPAVGAAAADPAALRLLDELREARDAYLDALQRAYRAGLSAHDLRSEGAVGRELE